MRERLRGVLVPEVGGGEVEVRAHPPQILLVKIMLCSKLHCQKSFKLKHISYKILSIKSNLEVRERLRDVLVPEVRGGEVEVRSHLQKRIRCT